MEKKEKVPTKSAHKKKGRKNEPEPPPPPPPPPRSRKKILLVAVLAGMAAIAGAFALLSFLQPEKEEKAPVYPAHIMEHLAFEDAFLFFIWEHIPQSYEALRGLNAELALIGKEMNRIEAIAQRFPDQRRIPQSEMREWESLRREVETSISRAGTALQALYVTRLVNAEKGRDAIRTEADAISSDLRTTLALSRSQTIRLDPDPFAPRPSMAQRVLSRMPWMK
ncbi:hypothetical protein OOT00_04945 [Desulfobotulus sp. H1]|uniref:Uncharacterized protein n=1 Tax=Desulfobotulus pelophilus TaxID=2823377 RepID=A0ABT3N8G2_9BACT|nr:hypothetical protein [Desulfobotulus pelophilus]MCW7753332.1 hypothetical protein [Desulfobotulus pelophilus]